MSDRKRTHDALLIVGIVAFIYLTTTFLTGLLQGPRDTYLVVVGVASAAIAVALAIVLIRHRHHRSGQRLSRR